MITQFFADWNAALQARKVVKEFRNQAGVIISQETEFTFRNVKIKMFSRLRAGDEHRAENLRRWSNELFVPSTNKIVPSTTFPTKAKCAAAILACLVEGREHEDRMHARVLKRKEIAAEKHKKAWRDRIALTSFKDDADFVVEWIYNNSVPERSSWNDDLLNVLTKYDYYITGVGLSDKVHMSSIDFSLHQKRMFNTACSLLADAVKDRNGIDILTRFSISKNFLEPKENLPQGVYVVRSAYCKINDMCKLSNKMHYIVKFIADYLSKVFGTTVSQAITDLKTYRENKYNRLVERENRGEAPRPARTFNPEKKKNTNNGTRAFSTMTSAPITSVGDVFGDVLDGVTVAEQSHDNAKKKHGKKTSTSLVTNRQINGKFISDENNIRQKEAAAMNAATEKKDDEEQPIVEEPQDCNDAVIDEPVEEVVVNEEPIVQEGSVDALDDVPVEKPKKKSRKSSKLEDEFDAEDMAIIKKTGKGSKKRTSKVVDIDEL